MRPNKKSLTDSGLWVALFLLFWLALIQLPDQVLSPQLDSSWQGALDYFASRRLQFGKEVIFTFGPLGYVYSTVYSGYLLNHKIILQLLTKGIFALLAIVAIRHSGKTLGGLFTLNFLLLSPILASLVDPLFLFSITLLLSLLVKHEGQQLLFFCTSIFLAFVSLIKLSFLLMSVTGLLFVVGFCIWLRRWQELGLGLGTYLVAFLVFELISGQEFSEIISFLLVGMQISTGYEKTMFLNEPSGVFLVGVTLLLLAGVILLGLSVVDKKNGKNWAIVALCGATLFVAWKQGFIRADGHVLIFLLLCQLILVTACAMVKPPIVYRNAFLALTLAIIFIAHIGIFLVIPDYYKHFLPITVVDRVSNNLLTVIRMPSYLGSLQQRLNDAKIQYALPKLKSAVAQDTIDVFGYEQAIVLLNDMNYHPRPVFQGYAAYTPFLVNINRDFYKSETAPNFVLFKLQTIDGRFPAADDSAVLKGLLLNYKPIAVERGYILWRAKEDRQVYTFSRLIKTDVAVFGDRVYLPMDVQALWLRIEWESTWLGRLREFFYKPCEVTMEISTAQDQTEHYRLVAPLAQAGFLISPPLRDTFDAIQFISGAAERRTQSFQLKASNNAHRMLHREFRYELYAGPDFPVGTTNVIEAWQLEYSMFRSPPRQVLAIHPTQTIRVDGQNALLAHAPSQIVFDIPKSARLVEGQFGILPGAYEGGRTDGVEFLVEMIDLQRKVSVHFQRYLQPLTQLQDRGIHFFSVPLPENSGGQIALRTTIGSHDDGTWDWSYWTNVQFK